MDVAGHAMENGFSKKSLKRSAASDRVAGREILRWSRGALATEHDALAVEEPLEIRLGGRRFTITMRTPGHDEELAAGFMLSEGFIATRDELGEIRRVRDRKGAPEPNVIDIVLEVPAAHLRERLRRNFPITSSCGLCGRTTIESLSQRISPVASSLRIGAAAIAKLGPSMKKSQAVFAETGGLHAAALFNRKGALDCVCEDIGRHNATDKVLGDALLRGRVPLGESLLMVSGRLSFEIVQKAAAAGVPILAGVSAPSSLAVELADELGVTLIGFLRGTTFNVYAHPERVVMRR
ncbi:MAG TPA: formate dehydrogenase accessory sulfurtransferase FdhD [Candidatus Binataceae bacterium]|nr:formate dehydrogenase accessory sulfurtransferase FdhD [Candidatus Binataceae bacterium]